MVELETLRHSCSHVMAAAISDLHPSARFGVGPAVEGGFYYDVLFDEPIGPGDLEAIEARMRKIRKKKQRFVRHEWDFEQARTFFESRGQAFKVELIDLLRARGSTAVVKEVGDANLLETGDAAAGLSVYQLDQFYDLCRGPHVEHSGQVGVFKLHRLAGAYWRGDERNPQLQRIYGLCFPTQKQLEAELERLEQIKLRDHRRIGKEMDIFHLSPEVGSGLPLWLPNGAAIRDELEALARDKERRAGYRRVSTPHITHEALYFQSGHLPYYAEDMYAPIEIDEKRYYLRPMNCPHHHHIYLSRPRSYKDLPYRIAEYGQVYRYEKSGGLSGTMRSRGFCQNDAHIYCTHAQAKEEFKAVMRMHAEYYDLFKIEDFYMRLSLPDYSKLDKYVEAPEKWLAALDLIRQAMRESGLPYVEEEGEAAFYGPKVDFIIKSAMGVPNAISTNQLDFLASERFGLTYTGADGEDHPVYVIHRAPLGSHERFIAFLTEHYAGRFPIWLAPEQAVIIPISEKTEAYARALEKRLSDMAVANGTLGLRVLLDASGERMQKKVRLHSIRNVPVLLIVGEQEQKNGEVSVRLRDGRDLGPVPVDRLCKALKMTAETRRDEAFAAALAPNAVGAARST
ncbi:MAG: threonine--tRNA ligase [Oceanicaulis sp.]